MRFAIIGLFLLTLAGAGLFLSCSVMTTSSGSRVLSDNIQVLRFRWKKKMHSNVPNFIIPGFYEQHDRFSPVETAGVAFDTDQRRIFVGAGVGGFYCIDVRTGQTIWRYDLDHPVGSTPYYDDTRRRVYVGVDDGHLYAFHSRSGRLIWRTDTGAELRRNVWMAEDTLYVVNADNTVLAIDPHGGEIIWRYRRLPVDGFSSVGYSDLRMAGSTLVVGFSDGMLVALDAGTGVEQWAADLAAETVATSDGDSLRLLDVDATPVIDGDIVVAASLSGGVHAVSLDNGSTIWTRTDIDHVTGLVMKFGEVYAVRAGERGMIGLSPQTGETLLDIRFGLGIKADPVLYDDLILVSDSEAGLYVLSAGTGRLINHLDMFGGFYARPVINRGYMLIMGNWATLFSFAIH